MGRQVNLDAPLSEVDKTYLRERGRGYLIHANERKFGVNGENFDPDTMEPGTNSPFYDSNERQKAVYDVGGAPLPGTTLDYNTGRVADRENGVSVEFTGPGHTPGAHDLRGVRGEPEGFDSYEVDENGNPVEEIDDDIVEKVLAIGTVKELRSELKALGVDVPNNARRDDLEQALAIALQDARDEGDENGENEESENESDDNSSGDFPTSE